MSINTATPLPIADYEQVILDKVAGNPVTIIQAETGAGKSTQVPQYLLKAGCRVIVTQPRRLAVRTVAARVAEELGEELGSSTIGYHVAGEQVGSLETRLLFCTDGLALVRELLGQTRAQVLVLDEVHEWNENMEVLVAWTRHLLEKGSNLKVVLMSATMEAERLSAYYGSAPIVSIPGRTFPVEGRPMGGSLEADILSLVKEGRNVLAFQPGKAEITTCVSEVERRLEACNLHAEILPLHGELTAEEQAKCFRRYGCPKVVVSTNVAQTSVTIDDIDAVVDSGLERRVEVHDGVEGLYLRPISLADAAQRKGRAGRTHAGVYIDHCGASNRPEFPVAEILRQRLDQTVLRLAVAGLDMEELKFFHQPNIDLIRAAKQSLIKLGCLTPAGAPTPMGRNINRLPVSVNYGRMIVEASERGVLDDILTVAAILEEGGLTVPTPSRNRPDRPDWRKQVPEEHGSDAYGQLMLYKKAESMSKDEMRIKGIKIKSYFRIKDLRRRLANAVSGRGFKFGSTGNREQILKSICSGMVDHLYRSTSYGYLNGDRVERELGQSSIISPQPNWLVGQPFDLEVKGRRGVFTLRLIEMATAVEPEWLAEVAPQLVETKTGLLPRYYDDHDSVTSVTETYFNGMKISEKRVLDPEHEKAAEAFAHWLALHLWPVAAEAIQASNRDRQMLAHDLDVRAGTSLELSTVGLEKFFLSSLEGARRFSEITNLEALRLPPVDPPIVAQIRRDYPDTVEVLGKYFEVIYRQEYYGPQAPYVKIDFSREGLDFYDLPDEVHLPGGKEILIVPTGVTAPGDSVRLWVAGNQSMTAKRAREVSIRVVERRLEELREAEQKAAEEAARREAERKAAEEAARREAEQKATEEAIRRAAKPAGKEDYDTSSSMAKAFRVAMARKK